MKTLLIPSAALIPKEMRNKFGEIPAILYPLNGIPLIEHLYEQYKTIVDKVVIVLYKKKELVIDYVTAKNLNIEIVELDEMNDLGYTILKGLEFVNQQLKTDELYINFADTLVYDDGLDKISVDSCFCIYKLQNETWTFFQTNQKNQITEIFDKQELADKTNPPQRPLFVGCFYLTNPVLFYRYILESKNDTFTSCDTFYIALQKYSQHFHMNFPITKQWFDVGHSENYLKAKTGVQARSFNTIEIDESRGILKKSSLNKEKFINEINWYLKLPNKLQYLIPRIYDYSTDRENPYIAMECYGYNTLHEIFLYGDLPLYKWQNIFEKLKFIINDMSQFTVKSSNEFIDAMENMYVKKTLSRLTSLKRMSQFSEFFYKDIVINNIQYHSLDYYIKLIPKVVKQELLDSSNISFNIIHGDLCFSNILLEENHGFMRIIDPRGEFGSFDIYGDSRYEMAKLLHSIEGKYDFIIEDMFKVKVDGTNIKYTMQKKTNKILYVFHDVFKENLGEYQNIKLIESMLFLSMIPLHSDYLSRQFAMLATGIQLLDEVLKEKGYE